ncbi:D-alanyl-D-alanine carboxypeptidase [Rhodobacteraceae bacterium RKSG542]|nr:D-alanyl-D-alanine carboxypeptidase [Pseudovibrio flavus]
MKIGRLGRVLAVCLLSMAYTATARADVAAWITVDASNGTVLEEHEIFQQWYPASLTKMMTAYIAFRLVAAERFSLTSPVTISQNALNQPPSKMGFKVGTQMTLDNALNMIMIKSANDISVAIAETLGGTEKEFIRMMNEQARRLGMTHTRFVNPHGLPNPNQVSSARDLAILALALWNEFPQYHSYMDQSAIRFGKITMPSGNKDYLLRVQGANGMKTGYICDAGYNVATSATRHGRTVIAVVLGAGSGLERAAFAKKLVDDSFAKSGRATVYSRRSSNVKKPPEAKYCKRNESLSAQQLVDRFGSKRGQLPILAYARGDEQMPDGVNVVGNNKKVNWKLVYEEILGPQIKEYAPVRVKIGLPKSAVAELTLPGETVPLPTPKPALSQGRKQSNAGQLNQSFGMNKTAESASIFASSQNKDRKQYSENQALNEAKQIMFGAPGGLYSSN